MLSKVDRSSPKVDRPTVDVCRVVERRTRLAFVKFESFATLFSILRSTRTSSNERKVDRAEFRAKADKTVLDAGVYVFRSGLFVVLVVDKTSRSLSENVREDEIERVCFAR